MSQIFIDCPECGNRLNDKVIDLHSNTKKVVYCDDCYCKITILVSVIAEHDSK